MSPSRARSRHQIERLEDRWVPVVTVGIAGDSFSDEFHLLGIPEYTSWVELLVESQRIDAGPIGTFPLIDPRAMSLQSYTYNFAGIGHSAASALGYSVVLPSPTRLVENYASQVGSTSSPSDWGGLRQLGLSGTIEYAVDFLGMSDLLRAIPEAGLPFAHLPAVMDEIVHDVVTGLNIITANGTSPVKPIVVTMHDLGSIPAWNILNFSSTQIANINWNIDYYNAQITAFAQSNNWGIIDLGSLYDQARSPAGLFLGSLQIDPFNLPPLNLPQTEQYTFFTWDGYHATPILQGLIANEIIRVMIDHYGETDVSLLSVKEIKHFAGLDSNDAPTAAAGGPYVIAPGAVLALDASASIDPDGDVLTFSWDVNGDGNFGDATGVNPLLDWNQLAALGIQAGQSYNVRVRADDGFVVNHLGTSSITSLTINPFTVSIDQAGSAVEGSGVSLSALPSHGGATAFAWDLDNDGEFDDTPGSTIVFAPTDNGTSLVGLQATSPYGVATATLSITVASAAPTVAWNSPPPLVRGLSATFSLSVTDPSVADMAVPFSVELDWDGDGFVDEVVLATPGANVSHAFSSRGAIEARARATDKDGHSGGWASLIGSVGDWAVLPSEQGSTFDLVWHGTGGNDHVTFEWMEPGEILVRTFLEDGVTVSRVESASGVTGIIRSYGDGGEDLIDAHTLTDVRVKSWGGEGNDTIKNGLASDTTFGGDGHDTIYGDFGAGIDQGSSDWLEGGDGNDLLEADGAEGSIQSNDTLDGGMGHDTLNGGPGNDLLDAGSDNDVVYADGSEGRGNGRDTIYGGAGNDTIFGDATKATTPYGGADVIVADAGNDWIDAGGGNDFIQGDDGDDLILGGDGAEGANDTLWGGAGRDVLVGDGSTLGQRQVAGADEMLGGQGEDLLVTGSILVSGHQAFFAAVMSEWTSERAFADRVHNLLGIGTGDRLNGERYLIPVTTILNDNPSSAIDLALGEGDSDWLLADLTHDQLDSDGADTLTDIGLA